VTLENWVTSRWLLTSWFWLPILYALVIRPLFRNRRLLWIDFSVRNDGWITSCYMIVVGVSFAYGQFNGPEEDTRFLQQPGALVFWSGVFGFVYIPFKFFQEKWKVSRKK
jgi:hypothetical protein